MLFVIIPRNSCFCEGALSTSDLCLEKKSLMCISIGFNWKGFLKSLQCPNIPTPMLVGACCPFCIVFLFGRSVWQKSLEMCGNVNTKKLRTSS